MKSYLVLKISILIVLLFAFKWAVAQSPMDNYQPLKPSGEMPKVFKTHFFNRFEQRDKELKEEFNEKHTDFALQSSYYFDLLLQSGRLIYGSPLNEYVDNIANEILKYQPELQNKISFYILRVPYVNAFALDPGIVLVTTGLLAKIENDAQLAFILCHEMIHIIKKHNIDLYLTKKKLKKEKNPKFESNIDTRIYKYHFRSRENENEADKLGMEMLLSKTDFDVNISDGIFHVLKYGHRPFAEKEGFIKQFETEFYVFPKRVLLEKILPAVKKEDESDTLSTHPNIDARTIALKQTATPFAREDRKLFFTNVQDFKNMQQLARFEMIHYQLLNHEYVASIYNAWVMLEEFPENRFLQNAMATSLYGITKYKTNGYASEIILPYREQEGEMQMITYFFQRLNRLEMPILAMKFAWNLNQQNKSDYLSNIIIDLASELKSQNIKPNDFSNQKNISNVSLEELFKGDAKSKFKNDQVYLSFAFANQLDLPDFIEVFNQAEYLKNDDIDILKKRKSKIVSHEPIHKIITFNPYYVKVDQRRKQSARIMTTQKKEIQIKNDIVKMSEKLKLDNKIYTSHQFTDGNTQYYSDFSLLSDWITEFINVNNNFEMHYYQNQYMDDFKQRNATKYLNLIGFYSHVSKTFTKEGMREVKSKLFRANIPMLIYTLFTPDYTTSYQQLLVDIETGKIIQGNSAYSSDNSRSDFMNSNMYHSLNQIIKPKK